MNKFYKIFKKKMLFVAVIVLCGANMNIKAQTLFEIWNWEDLSLIPTMRTSGYDTFMVMQAIGVPGGNNYGDGTGMSPAIETTHPGNKKYGWYGYEGFGEGVSGFNTALTDAQAATLYASYGGTNVAYGWNATGWIPLTSSMTVNELLDGDGHTISGLWINRTTSAQGLFLSIYKTSVKNLNLRLDPVKGIKGSGNVGGLAGSMLKGTSNYSLEIHNVRVYGNITASGEASGGLIGHVNIASSGVLTASIEDCSYIGNLSSNSFYAGGFIGKVTNSSGTILLSISRSYTKTSVTGTDRWDAGFIAHFTVGSTSSVMIDQCYTEVKINFWAIQANNSGSFLGGWSNARVTVNNCYSICTVGQSAFDASVASTWPQYCYSVGDMYIDGNNCYYNEELLVDPHSNYSGFKSTAEMTQNATYVGWNISNDGSNTIWQIDEGMTTPYLKWQKDRTDVSHTYGVSSVTYSLNGGPAIPYYGPSVTLTNAVNDVVVFTVTNADADRIYSPYGADVQFSGSTATITITLKKVDQTVAIGFASESDIVNWIAPPQGAEEVQLDLTLFLQGVTKPGPIMTNYIQEPDIFMSRFSAPQLPVNYTYKETTATYADVNNPAGPAGQIVDWIIVEIWGNYAPYLGVFTNYDMLERQLLFLQPDGKVVDATGNIPKFSPQTGDVQIVVKHRNHMAVMSNVVLFESGMLAYDFSSSLSQAYQISGAPAPMVFLNGEVYGLWAGDLNDDGNVNSTDTNKVNADLIPPVPMGIYMTSDVNMDGQINASDTNLIRENALRMLRSPIINFYEK